MLSPNYASLNRYLPQTVWFQIRRRRTRFTQYDRPISVGFDLASLGFPASLLKQLERSATSFPEIAIDGYASLGDTSGSRDITTFHSLSGTASPPPDTPTGMLPMPSNRNTRACSCKTIGNSPASSP